MRERESEREREWKLNEEESYYLFGGFMKVGKKRKVCQ